MDIHSTIIIQKNLSIVKLLFYYSQQCMMDDIFMNRVLNLYHQTKKEKSHNYYSIHYNLLQIQIKMVYLQQLGIVLLH